MELLGAVGGRSPTPFRRVLKKVEPAARKVSNVAWSLIQSHDGRGRVINRVSGQPAGATSSSRLANNGRRWTLRMNSRKSEKDCRLKVRDGRRCSSKSGKGHGNKLETVERKLYVAWYCARRGEAMGLVVYRVCGLALVRKCLGHVFGTFTSHSLVEIIGIAGRYRYFSRRSGSVVLKVDRQDTGTCVAANLAQPPH